MAMLPIPFILWGSIAFQRLRYAAVREQVSLLNSRLANNLTGIKSFTAENMKQRVWQLKEAYRQSNRRAIVPVLPLYLDSDADFGGVHSIAVVWRYGSRCRKNVCRLQCVSVPDPTVALAEIGRNI